MPPLILTSTDRHGVQATRCSGPRLDFDVLASVTRATVSLPGGGAAAVAWLDAKLRLDLAQAARARRTSVSAYISLSERIGLPLSVLGPSRPQVVVAHLLTSRSKRRAQLATRFLNRVDLVVVFSRAQERYLRDEVGLGPERARLVSDKVDQFFFTPAASAGDGAYVLSVGREQRDFSTLIEAVRPLRVPCIIVPGSAWSHRNLQELALPDHVSVQGGLSYPALRDLYRGARVIVVPIVAGTDYAAGVNTILEAMACGRPVIASATPGLAGYVRDGFDGLQVSAGDAEALRRAIEALWHDSRRSRALGDAARQTVELERTMDGYAARIAEWVGALA